MKHKSRFLLPILTFLTFGMVAGSVVAADYVKEEAQVADAASENVSNIHIIAADETRKWNCQHDRRITYYNNDNDCRPIWVEINNSHITFVSTSGYSSISDITETIGAYSYVRTDGNDKYLRIKLWHSYGTSYDNDNIGWQVELPWYIKSISQCYYFIQYNSVDWYLQKQNNNKTYTTHSEGKERATYFKTSDSWWLNWDTSGTLKYGDDYVSSETAHTNSTEYFNITISAGSGGTVTPSVTNQKYYKGQILTLVATPSSYYDFASWSDGGNQTHKITVTSSTPTTITASFTAYSRSVTFHQNIAPGIDDPTPWTTSVTYPSNLSVPDITNVNGSDWSLPLRSFDGWYDTSSESGGNKYTSVPATTKTALHLYARWKYYSLGYRFGTSGDYTEFYYNEQKSGNLRNYSTHTAIAQPNCNTPIYFAYRTTSGSGAWTAIAPTASNMGLVGGKETDNQELPNNLKLVSNVPTIRFSNVTGYLDARVVRNGDSFKLYVHAKGLNNDTGGPYDPSFYIIKRHGTGDDTMSEIVTTNYSDVGGKHWYNGTVQLEAGDRIAFFDAVTRSGNTGTEFNPKKLSSNTDGFSQASQNAEAICTITGNYYIQLEASEGTSYNQLHAARQTWIVNYSLNGRATASGLPSTEYYVPHDGTIASAPTAPTATDALFVGWYTDPACEDEDLFTFGTTIVTEDTTLYAKWDPITVGKSFIISNKFGVQYSILTKYSVLYDTIQITAPKPQYSYVDYQTTEYVPNTSAAPIVDGKTIVNLAVNSAHLTAEITFNLLKGGNIIYTETLSLSDMAASIAGSGSYSTDSKDVKALKSSLTYATYSQLYFGVGTTDLANKDISAADKTAILNAMNSTDIPTSSIASPTIVGTPNISITGIAFGSSDGFTLRFKLNFTGDVSNYEAILNDAPSGVAIKIAYDEARGHYYAYVSGISASNLRTALSITLRNKTTSGTYTFSASVGTYCSIVDRTESIKSDTGLYNLCKAVNLLAEIEA